MQPTVKLQVKQTRQEAKLIADVQGLASLSVLVGIPEKTTERKGGEITNAQVLFLNTKGVRATDMRRIVRAKMNKGATYNEATQMYLHSHGSPLMQIPQRPLLEPAIEEPDNKKAITDQLEKAGKAVLDGKKADAMKFLNLAGQEAVNRVRAWFTDARNGWAPNAPSTIKAKGSNRPLIDTGALRKAVSYVIRGKQ
jgi:hypothetical protein